MDRATRLQPLGHWRLRALDCLGGNTPQTAGYFVPAADITIFAAFRDHAVRLSQQWHAESDPMTVSLLAVARLLCGEIAAADVILDRLPAQPVRRDHGAGRCLVLPVQALAAVLPLPPELADSSRWLAGSPAQADMRAWLNVHRGTLRWDETGSVYRSAE